MSRGKHNRPVVSRPVLALITSISRTDRRLTLDRLFHILVPFAHSVSLVSEKCDKRRNKRDFLPLPPLIKGSKGLSFPLTNALVVLTLAKNSHIRYRYPHTIRSFRATSTIRSKQFIRWKCRKLVFRSSRRSITLSDFRAFVARYERGELGKCYDLAGTAISFRASD